MISSIVVLSRHAFDITMIQYCFITSTVFNEKAQSLNSTFADSSKNTHRITKRDTCNQHSIWLSEGKSTIQDASIFWALCLHVRRSLTLLSQGGARLQQRIIQYLRVRPPAQAQPSAFLRTTPRRWRCISLLQQKWPTTREDGTCHGYLRAVSIFFRWKTREGPQQ